MEDEDSIEASQQPRVLQEASKLVCWCQDLFASGFGATCCGRCSVRFAAA